MNRRMIKRAEQQITGLILRWTDPDPLLNQEDPIPREVTHKNRVLRIYAKHIFDTYVRWITQEHTFRWKITANVVFHNRQGELKQETIVLTSNTLLAEVNDAVMNEIEAAVLIIKLEGGEYITTEFEIECMGACR
jgi:hypothetical protein